MVNRICEDTAGYEGDRVRVRVRYRYEHRVTVRYRYEHRVRVRARGLQVVVRLLERVHHEQIMIRVSMSTCVYQCQHACRSWYGCSSVCIMSRTTAVEYTSHLVPSYPRTRVVDMTSTKIK